MGHIEFTELLRKIKAKKDELSKIQSELAPLISEFRGLAAHQEMASAALLDAGDSLRCVEDCLERLSFIV